MKLSTILWAVRNGAPLIDPPDGPQLAKAASVVQASLGRIQKDCPPLSNAAAELMPIIQKHGQFFVDISNWAQKHWKSVLSSANDLIPIVEAILNDLKG